MKQQKILHLGKQDILGFILFIAGVVLLAGVFVKDSIINPGLQINQYVYYNTYIPLFAFCVLLSVWVNGKKYPLKWLFYKKEILVFVFAVVAALTYRWQLNPASERLFFLFQVCGLWYLLRIATYHYPLLSVAWSVVLMLMGGVQAVIGLMQLYGWEYSNHALFTMTGSFFNPGPYSGFLALTLPIAVFFILRYRHYQHVSWGYKWVRWFAWLCALLVFIALPATLGRTAWIATVVASLWVLWREMGWLLKPIWRKHRLKAIVAGLFLITGLAVLSVYSYQLKSASANGRLFLWEMDFKAWINNLEGTGLGRFPVAYGEVQAAYFDNGHYSEVEESVAGTPVYAFNEYLQLLVEHSFLGLIIVLIMGCLVFHCGYWNRQAGWVGVLIALCIFSFASYPLQLPVFMIILIFASIGCMSWKRRDDFYEEDYPHSNRLKTIVLVILLALVECFIACWQWNIEKPYREWEKSRMLYHIKAYEKVIDPYDKLLLALGAQPDFLFEYGHALAKIGEYNASNRILKKGTMISADPMFWNVMGKNYQAMGNYSSAEQCYLKAMNILPSRIYPYYLLTKLYAEPDINRKDRILPFGKTVLEKEPKVQSTAIKQMRNEIRQLLKNN